MRQSLITIFVAAAAAFSFVVACGPSDEGGGPGPDPVTGLDATDQQDPGLHDDAGTDAGAIGDAGSEDAGFDAGIADAGVDAGPPGPVSFSRDIQPIFDAQCVSCHSSASANGPEGGLDLSGSKSFGQLVDVNAKNATCSNLKRVMPGVPALSFLFLKVTGQQGACGGSMPEGGTLPRAEYKLIESWISAGAPNN